MLIRLAAGLVGVGFVPATAVRPGAAGHVVEITAPTIRMTKSSRFLEENPSPSPHGKLALEPKFVLRLIREASTTFETNEEFEDRVQKNVQSVSFLVVRGKAAQPPKC